MSVDAEPSTASPAHPTPGGSHVACPFCALLCDDLELVTGASPDRLRLESGGCRIARERFERPASGLEPLVDGKPASRREALQSAASLLAAARSPLLGGLATDVGGVREAVALAERTGGMLDHAGSPGLHLNLKTMRERGWVLTTFGEVRNRVDLLVLVGTTGVDAHPRFFERLVDDTDPLFGDFAEGRRDVVLVGKGLKLRSGDRAKDKKIQRLDVPLQDLPEAAFALLALLHGERLDSRKPAGVGRARLQALLDALRGARYPVIAWHSGALPEASAALTVQAWSELVRALNVEGRCSALTLGGDDGLITANQVCTWQTGFPLPVSFVRGYPEHHPRRYNAEAALASGEADLLLWISALGSALKPPPGRVPLIELSDTGPSGPARVFLPVGTAGIDHAGSAFRADNVACLPLRALRPATAPGVAATLRDLMRAL